MTKQKISYVASAHNDSGAYTSAGHDTNINRLKSNIRATFGSGWIIEIKKIVNDSGIMDFASEIVATFKIR